MSFVLVDFNHLCHRFFYGAAPLSTTVNIGGMPITVNTTIANYIIKALYRWSQGGKNYIAVCHEGGNLWRKDYFASGLPNSTDSAFAYKDGRGKLTSSFTEAMNIATNLLNASNISQYRVPGYEADDLIYALISYIEDVYDKQLDPLGTGAKEPIYVITNDADMLPLVSDRVSVYMKGTRTYHEAGALEIKNYFQVTPRSWNDYIWGTSAYCKYTIPYNSMLLYKLIRGDKSDCIPASVSGYGAVKYSALMDQMSLSGVDFANVFRYDSDFANDIRPILCNYFDDTVLDKMEWVYNGMRLRRPDCDLLGINKMRLETVNKACSMYQINIK